MPSKFHEEDLDHEGRQQNMRPKADGCQGAETYDETAGSASATATPPIDQN
jgi:hypothetical protein